MIYLAYFLILFAVLRLLIAGINFISFHHLPTKISKKPELSYSILIPARNEEENLNLLLPMLAKLKYYPLEILIYDDESNDSTREIIVNHARLNSKIRLLEKQTLPKGWLGKNHACHSLALEAKGELLLFMDADVKPGSELPERAISYLTNKKLHLLSIFPQQILLSRGEKQIVPLMNLILLSLLPLFLIRISSWISFSAANGQFMLFRADTYKKLLPHFRFKSNPVEDIAILRDMKKQKYRVDTLLGDSTLQCRMYADLPTAREGFSKNILQFFGNSTLIAVFFTLITSLAFPFTGIVLGVKFGLIYLIILLLTRFFISLASKQSLMMNLLFMIPQQYNLIRLVLTAIKRKRNKTLVWKERNISNC